jgi:nucleotide-binding universal stress UspA family protein
LEEIGAVSRAVVRKAKLADLVVTAGLAKNAAALVAFEAVLIAARRPVLIASPTNPERLPSKNVVIAWNGSTEVAYAVTRALPLLKAAQSVTVLSAELDLLDVPSPAALVAYLTLHEIKASAAALDLSGKSVGPALIERSASLGADLIVMGGYGHSRLREFILGGVTRHMITNATTAVLLAH